MTVSGSHEWRSIAPMSTRRSSVGVGVLGGLIYAVGRTIGVGVLDGLIHTVSRNTALG